METLQTALLWSLFPLLCAATTCPCGATYNSQFDKCYVFRPDRKSFLEAQQTCQDMEGQLVSIHNGFENSLAVQGATDGFCTDDFWIGCSDVDQQGTWAWTDGSRVNYTNWANGYPDGQDGHDCIAIQLSSGKWRSVGCFTTKPFICEIPLHSATLSPSVAASSLPTCPPPQLVCPSEWTYFAATDACYKTFFGSYSFFDADASCMSFNGHLTSIHSDEENTFIISIAQTGTQQRERWTYIGLHSLSPNIWTWTDQTSLNYTNWTPGHPLSNGLCAYLIADQNLSVPSSTYKWYSRDCSSGDIRNFVCKKSAKH